jgi:hypothetical protein
MICSEGYISEGNALICFILVVKQYFETKYITDKWFSFAFEYHLQYELSKSPLFAIMPDLQK